MNTEEMPTQKDSFPKFRDWCLKHPKTIVALVVFLLLSVAFVFFWIKTEPARKGMLMEGIPQSLDRGK